MAMELTVGKRIVFGFTLTILIAVALGGMGVWNMFAAKADSTKLATEYIPEVKVATDLRGSVNRLMYQMRGYGMTEDEKYYKNASTELGAVSKHLTEASELAASAKHLNALKGQVDTASTALNEYEGLMRQTEETIASMTQQRIKLDKNAASYMQNCSDFLAGQNAAFKKDLQERQAKVSIAKSIADLGTAVRVGNFKAQTNSDTELMEQTIAKLDEVKALTAEILPLTRQKVNLDQISKIEAAAKSYGSAMQLCLVELQKGQASVAADRVGIQKKMDSAAQAYVKNCDDFLQSQQEALTREMNERHEKITLVNDIISLGNDARVKAFKSQALRSPAIMEDALSNFPALDKKYADLLKITRLQADIERIEKTQASGANYAAALQDFLDDWHYLQALGGKREQAGQKLIDACKVTADAGMNTTQEISTNAATTLSQNASIMSVGLAVGAVVAIVLALLIIRSVTGPLGRIIETLQGGSANVAVAAGQVSESSQSLASGASEQAASIEETNSSVEEMASMIKNSANNAVEASDLSATATKTAISGADAMSRMSQAIDDIKAGSDETAKIVKTIDEIAFQTNLLALNAAVEAARAGEAGKGFAVVAEEVRNLAQRSADAARNTADIIEGSIRNADNGVEISKEVASFLNEISEGSRKVNDLISDIATANKEQASGIDQITRAVSQMDQVTQANAADAEESAAASEELSAQAEQVDDVVTELQRLVSGAAAAAKVDMSRLKREKTGQIQSNIQRRKAGMKSAYTGGAMNVNIPATPSDSVIDMSVSQNDEAEMVKF